MIWLLERRHEGGIISNRKYFRGIFEAGFWGLLTLAAQAEGMPRQWLARTLSVFWMFAGVVFIASYPEAFQAVVQQVNSQYAAACQQLRTVGQLSGLLGSSVLDDGIGAAHRSAHRLAASRCSLLFSAHARISESPACVSFGSRPRERRVFRGLALRRS